MCMCVYVKKRTYKNSRLMSVVPGNGIYEVSYYIKDIYPYKRIRRYYVNSFSRINCDYIMKVNCIH